MYVYDAAWLALGLLSSAVLAVAAVLALRSRGIRPALFLAGLAMLPMAGYLTGTLRLFGVIVDQVSGYVIGFAFSPKVWLGVILAGVGVVLMGAASMMKRRGIAEPRKTRRAPAAGNSTGNSTGNGKQSLPPRKATTKSGPAGDIEGMDDIEAILRKHGIS